MQAFQQATTTSGSSAHDRFDEEVALHGRISAGDESALLECLDRFGHVVYCMLLHLTGDVDRTEDLTLRAFVSLWRAPAAFDPRHGPMVLQLLGAILRSASGTSATPSAA